MKVMVLAGGQGKRLRPLTFSIPKPLLPVGDKPILDVILEKLKKQGFKDIVLAVGYKSELIKDHFQDGKGFGVNIEYLKEDTPLGTAGPLSILNKKVLLKEPLILMNGDILTKIDFRELVKFHKKEKADITVAMRKHTYQSPYGVIKTKGNKITKITEKPKTDFLVSAGIYVISPNVLVLLKEGEYFDMPDLINLCMKKGKKVLGYGVKDYWTAVERIDSYKEAIAEKDKWI